MQNRTSKSLAACFAAAAMMAGGAAHALPLVSNGDFETGNFSGWTQSGDTSWSGVDSNLPHDGSYAAFFGTVGTTGSISQTLTTIAGAVYQVSFWLQNEADPQGVAAPNSFEFNWDGGAAELALTDAAAFGYTQYSYSLTASTATTDLMFTFNQEPAFWDLDSVSVEAMRATVPEPGSLALVSLAGLLSFAVPRRRRS